MAKKKSPPNEFNELRKKAEKLLAENGEKVPRIPLKGGIQGLSQELSVYHIELEMQNDELRRAQGELEELRLRYFDLYENAPVGYLTLDELGVVSDLNLTAARLLGIERAFLLKEPLAPLVAPESQDVFYLHLREVVRFPGTRTCELRLKRNKEGETFFHAQLASTAVQSNGTTAVRMVLTDITERKAAEEALRESEKRYHTLFNAIDEGFCIIEVIFDENERPVDYRFLEINAAFEKQTGLIDARGKRMRELAPKHEEHWFEIYGKIALTGQPARFENRAEQLHRWYDVYAFRYGQPANRQVAILFNDISDRKRAEAVLETAHRDLEKKVEERTADLQAEVVERTRLEEETRRLYTVVREEKDRLSSLINSMSDEVWFADTDKNFTLANPSALREFGFGAHDGIDVEKMAASLEVYRPDGTLRPVDEAPPLRALRGEAVRNQEEIVRTPARGELRNREVNAAPVRNAEGAIIGSVSVVRDITDRKKAEDAFQKSEERYRTTLASIGDAVITTDEEGSVTYLNRVAQELIGWAHEEAIGQPLERVFPIINELTRKPAENPVHRVLREGYVVGLANHTCLISRDGKEMPIEDSAAPIRDAGGRVTGVVMVFHDVTEKRKAENALRISEEHYRSLFDNMLNGFAYCKMIFDENGPKDFTYLNVNAAFGALTGLKNVIGKNVSEVIPGIRQSDPELFEIYGRVALTGAPERFETHVEALEMWFSISVYSPQKEYFVAVFDVITERKLAEEALQRSHEELEQRVLERTEVLRRQADLLELAYNAIVVCDFNGRITFWNARAEELYGFTRDEALGRVIHTLLQTRFPVPFEEHMTALTREGRWEGELTHTTKDGRQLVIASRQVLQRDETGQPVAIMEINLDMSEQKLVEAQLRQAQKMEALGTMSGGIAHDFNNILAAIIGFTELVAGHVAKDSRDARHLERVMEASIRGRELVRQMLAFSRKSEQMKKPLLVSNIVKESVTLLRASLPATISIRADTKGESGFILGDPVQIQQVLMNLCTNAAYAMLEKGGSLDVELSDYSVSPSNGDPHGIKPGLYVKLAVRDTGIGISPDIMGKIFDPFFTTKKLGEGTGLGLSVVHGIVNQHDGYITVESEPGKGSTFTVYLPRIAGEDETAAAVGDEIPTGSERILFIDDEEALVEMGEDILAELGYDVISRMSGREALELLKSDPSRFDLIITDQTMPEMTGVELATEILALRPDMPIIMCTGFSYVVDADKAKAAGIRAFAMKPLTKREIAKTVRKVLDG